MLRVAAAQRTTHKPNKKRRKALNIHYRRIIVTGKTKKKSNGNVNVCRLMELYVMRILTPLNG